MHLALAIVSVGVVTAVLRSFPVTNPTTVALSYLLLVLVVASASSLAVAVVTSAVAMLALNYFFFPPIGTLVIADPHNWVALFAFLVVAVVASQLSATARRRAAEALERRNEVARLFDVSRDVLLTTDAEDTTTAVARHVARRFELQVVTVCVPAKEGGWRLAHGGPEDASLDQAVLDRVWAAARGTLEFDATTRSYGGHLALHDGAAPLTLVPVRIGTRPVGIVALGGRPLDPGTADAIGGIVAVAIERARFLDDRRVAELQRQRADLSSALLASLGHDLRTPLTTIRVAIGNVGDPAVDPSLRAEQAGLALEQLDHLAQLLQEILDMARIEARAVNADRQWVTAGAIIDAAVAHVASALRLRRVLVDADDSSEVQVDPRLTSVALAHLLENAARYSPPDSPIEVRAEALADTIRISVTDNGPGIEPQEFERLFEPFVRGRAGLRQRPGTGLGLAITRGLLAAEDGQVWAENVPGRGARFTISVPGPRRSVNLAEPQS